MTLEIRTTLRNGEPVVIMVPDELVHEAGVRALVNATGDRPRIGEAVGALGRHGLSMRLVDIEGEMTFIIARQTEPDAPPL